MIRKPNFFIVFVGIAGCLLAGAFGKQQMKDELLNKVDHLVYATPDLAAGVDQVERLLGVEAIPGGQHPGGGTRNSLIRLGEGSYLEIIGPDPDQPKPLQARRFGIDDLKAPRLVTWAAKSADLEAIFENAKQHRIALGQIQSGSRKRPDGVLLSWRLTASTVMTSDGLVPFFIDWGKTPHPTTGLPRDCVLIALRAEHPDPNRIKSELSTLGLSIRVDSGSKPALVATIRTPKGEVELR